MGKYFARVLRSRSVPPLSPLCALALAAMLALLGASDAHAEPPEPPRASGPAGTPPAVADREVTLSTGGQQQPQANAARRRFTFSFVERGRFEGWRGTTPPDSFYLNRLRLQAEVAPAPWLRAVLQLQDSRAAGLATPGKPPGIVNELDVRMAFGELRHADTGLSLRVGRQELTLGEGRLVAASDWGNITRTFDAVSARLQRGRWHVTALAGQVVVTRPTSFDRRRKGEWLSGVNAGYSTGPGRQLESYLLVRTQDTVRGEDGRAGDATTVTVGARAVGPLPAGLDYGVEGALQRGHAASDDVEAWAAHALIGRRFPGAAWQPRVTAEYDAASGDAAPRDGVRGTFDPLYPSTHGKWGVIDRVTWRNMEHLAATLSLSPRRDTRVVAGAHRHWLREFADGYYNGVGVRVPALRPSSSRHVGDSVDAVVTVDVTKHLEVSAGLAYFFPGRYLREANAFRDQRLQYLMWAVRF